MYPAKNFQSRIIGIRAASDSLELPDVSDVVLHAQDFMLMERARVPKGGSVDLGTEFKASREIAAVVSAEFVVKPKDA